MGKRYFRHLNAATLVAALTAFVLAGCGGIEIASSPLLDAVGLSSKALNAEKAEPQLAPRAGIIVPPSLDKLPEPGSGQTAVAVANPDFPTNPEAIEAIQAKAREAAQKEACDDNNGEFGSRQGGTLDDFESPGGKKNVQECSSPLKDLLGNAL